MATRSFSSILSNSSIQITPRSARTMAPPSIRRSPVSWSRTMAAVKPIIRAKKRDSYLHLTSLYPSYLQPRELYSRQNARIGTYHKKDHQPNWVWFLWMRFIQEGHWYHHEGELHCLTHVPCLLRGARVRLAWYSHDPWWMEQYYYKGCDRYWDSWLEDKQGHFMAIHNSRILPIQSGVNSTFELFIEITEMWLAKMTGLMEPAVTCEVWGLHKIL